MHHQYTTPAPRSSQSTHETLLAKQQEPHRYLVFSGAGVKGSAFLGAAQELQTFGVLNKIESVSGCSSGAIPASLIAAGLPVARIREIVEQGPANLIGNAHGDSSLVKKLIGEYHYDWTTMATLFRKALLNNTRSFTEKYTKDDLHQRLKTGIVNRRTQIERDLTRCPNDPLLKKRFIDELKCLSAITANDLDTFLAKLDGEALRATFKDLYLLQLIEPKQFKGLVLVAADITDGIAKAFDFSVVTTPNVCITDAVLASSALPPLLKAVTLTLEEGQAPRSFLDGGFINYIPQCFFSTALGRILTMTFAFQVQHRAMFGSHHEDITYHNTSILGAVWRHGWDGWEESKTIPIMRAMLAFEGCYMAADHATQHYESSYRQLRDNAVDALVIEVATVSTVTFDAEHRQRTYLYNTGALHAHIFLNRVTQLDCGTLPSETSLAFKYALKQCYDKTYGLLDYETSKTIATYFAPEQHYDLRETQAACMAEIRTLAADNEKALTLINAELSDWDAVKSRHRLSAQLD